MRKVVESTVSLLFLFTFLGYSTSGQTKLFGSEEPLDLTLVMNLREVVNDIGDERTYHQAQLYHNRGVSRDTFDIKVRTRGFMRRNPNTCSFPPLTLNFKKKAVAGTIFEGQDKIKYVSHCRPMKDNLNNLFKEYLIYRQYEILTDYSFRTRLVKMNYVDQTGRKDPFDSYGILLEHKKELAARTGTTVYERSLPHQDRCFHPTLDLFTLFQFMIGNTDWGINEAHNVVLLRIDSLYRTLPVPYDFDYSGLINATYAEPDPLLPIDNVKKRYFRGFCRRNGEYEETIKMFQERREDLYDVFRNFQLLDERERKESLKYFDKFYDIIGDPKKVKGQIYGACMVKHKHLNN